METVQCTHTTVNNTYIWQKPLYVNHSIWNNITSENEKTKCFLKVKWSISQSKKLLSRLLAWQSWKHDFVNSIRSLYCHMKDCPSPTLTTTTCPHPFHRSFQSHFYYYSTNSVLTLRLWKQWQLMVFFSLAYEECGLWFDFFFPRWRYLIFALQVDVSTYSNKK